jgi:hypothetical protein
MLQVGYPFRPHLVREGEATQAATLGPALTPRSSLHCRVRRRVFLWEKCQYVANSWWCVLGSLFATRTWCSLPEHRHQMSSRSSRCRCWARCRPRALHARIQLHQKSSATNRSTPWLAETNLFSSNGLVDLTLRTYSRERVLYG